MTPAEDDVFTAFLREKAAEAQRAVKYKPNEFLKMLGSIGGYKTAVSLLTKPKVSDGFTRLYLERRLDLTVEAVILESRWARYFDEHLISSAEERLIKVGYTVVRPELSADAFSGVMDETLDVEVSTKSCLGSGVKSLSFNVGQEYTRAGVFALLGIPRPNGGKWYTGHFDHAGNHFLFCNIGGAGRTGHDYNNHFIDGRLVWYARSDAKLRHSLVSELVSQEGIVFVFYRLGDRDPFMFAGVATPFQVTDATDESPLNVVWDFSSRDLQDTEENPASITVVEGAASMKLVKVYERDRGARLQCVKRWGRKCFVCSFEFEKVYGELGKGFIHVHHLKPLSEQGGEYNLDPEQDLRPVCPNCHAMLHRSVPALTIEELQRQMYLASL
ncbi:HNH endonuclease [Pseudomonas alloputida]|uniref:HNH endonuclease n=1 Tax=Pseudomonas alloputida TaxID=1940621 RepID=A0AAW7HR02_9PSED|nr:MULTISPECIES: HNH endonuclease [Pseudomonas]MCE0864453.1 HNH endonuclease [Pseudomonas alloputida]MCE0870308.1 HNH endonuclease [Pseudomonas alloputida]MCE0893579.1 HNH endonuclease [Pseudomonas alloputida]MCE0911196.1 HNH endonuclease [Pseudomonas kurunegalensis]MCE0922816.1 HNH endonuclease [Pseudomonas alloputida]